MSTAKRYYRGTKTAADLAEQTYINYVHSRLILASRICTSDISSKREPRLFPNAERAHITNSQQHTVCSVQVEKLIKNTS